MENIKVYGRKFYTGLEPEYVTSVFVDYKHRLNEAVEKERASEIVKFNKICSSKYYLVIIVAETMKKHIEHDDTFIELKAYYFVKMFADDYKAFKTYLDMKEKMNKLNLCVTIHKIVEFDSWNLYAANDSAEKTLAKYQDK